MSTDWKITMKPSFFAELMALPAREMQQVMAKIQMLVQDPRPDGHVKMQLKHIGHRLHRIRCGDYRVFYTFEAPFVSLLALRRRQRDTYDENLNEEFLSGFDPDLPTIEDPITSPLPHASEERSLALAGPLQPLLPKPITSELLNTLRIPTQYHAVLLAIQSEDELLDCPEVPGYLLTRLLDHLWPSGKTRVTKLLPNVGADPPQSSLPKPITSELLNNLHIPTQYHAVLLAIQSEDELLDCSSVPQRLLAPLLEYLFPPSLQEVMQDPDWVLHEVDDLLRFKEGELLGFLLKLSPEQEKYVQRALHAHGPTLLKGGPGTGKSTIALYRVGALVKDLRRQGRDDFRILFATYTDALMRSSEQLLRQLLGEDIRYVDVKTTDAIASLVLGGVNATREGDINYCLQQAIEKAHDRLQQQAQRQTIERLSQDYLEQEINQVIIARQISSVEAYLNTTRPGRKVPLNATQRRAVWSVYEVYRAFLKACGWTTWPLLRSQAEQCVAHKRVSLRYDAVIIDEAQDLDVSALRMLIQLCPSPDRLFITADANQAIYGSGFSWSEVHANLRFQGRTAIVHTNYRSTREIGEATRSYLLQYPMTDRGNEDNLISPLISSSVGSSSGMSPNISRSFALGDGSLEQEVSKQSYAHSGPRPLVCAVASREDELNALKHFLTTAAREQRFSLGSCAILCPNKPAGQRIAHRLNTMGLQATFMSAREVDLERPGIKVMMLKSAKGLEFPIVAIAGFLGIRSSTGDTASSSIATGGEDADWQKEREEALACDRRGVYVGMTRAMRALLVIVPANIPLPLLTGFDPAYWDRG
jgi:superfamily I DNA/RNA helicase/mRNA-degrading endonuclease RelE of RelBE toxin-antitoxin system